MSNGIAVSIRVVGRRLGDGRFTTVEEALQKPDLHTIERYPAPCRLP